MIFKDTTKCKVCLSDSVLPLMDFGYQPNSYQFTAEQKMDCRTYGLDLWFCGQCGFVFIKNPIACDEIYTNYQWSTSFCPPKHINWLVGKMTEICLTGYDDFIVEVGSNDGYMLRILMNMNYTRILGVEPAEECAQQSVLHGIQTINSYFDETIADRIKEEYGVPRVVICRHVIEHLPDPNQFFENINLLINKDSVLVLEIPGFEMTADKGDISTIWEQHINYFTRQTITRLAARHGFSAQYYKYLEHGGGSLILFLTKAETLPRLSCKDISVALTFRDRAKENIRLIKTLLKGLKEMNKTIVAYGAGSRGICLINLSDISKFIDFIVDDNGAKTSMFLPNTHLKIVDSDALLDDKPDYCLILPMNRKELEHQIMERHADYVEAGGIFIELYQNNEINIINKNTFDALKRGW